MKIIVNRKHIEIFEGAAVKHALLRYAVVKGLDKDEIKEWEVYDSYGHSIDHEAPLHEQQKIRFKIKKDKAL